MTKNENILNKKGKELEFWLFFFRFLQSVEKSRPDPTSNPTQLKTCASGRILMSKDFFSTSDEHKD